MSSSLTLLSVVLLLVAGASPALAGAWWRLSSRAAPSSLPPGGTAAIFVSATNVGDGGVNATTSPVTIKDTLPPNLEAIKITGEPALWPGSGSPHDVRARNAHLFYQAGNVSRV